jgi:general nucleoside transport system permease protein
MTGRRFALMLAAVGLIVAAAVALGRGQMAAPAIVASMLRTTLSVATPLTLGALAGVYCERAGVVNIGIEGMMLLSAFGGFGAALAANAALGESAVGASLLIGVAAAVLCGGLAGAFHALLCITYRVDQIISGIVLNVLAIGLTGYLSGQIPFLRGPAHGPGVLPTIHLPGLADLPLVGGVFEQQPIALAALALVAITQGVLFHTVWGLRARAVGEHPRAADTAGIDVARVRWANVIVGGLVAGLAGAYFTLESVPTFEPLMTNGRGFIALAAMIFGGWTPLGAWAASLVFGAAQALQINAQQFGLPVPSQLVGMLPYLLTMLTLAGLAGRSRPPAADGQPYDPHEAPA